jgi:hypothetical protein
MSCLFHAGSPLANHVSYGQKIWSHDVMVIPDGRQANRLIYQITL